MSDKPLLYYFEGRGLAETIRITFCLAGVEFEEKFLKTREEFLQNCDDGTFLFRCVPYLKWGDLEMNQSTAIVRYISRKTGLMGKDDEESARIDMMYEGTRDFYRFFLGFGFMDSDPIIENIKETVLPKFLPLFNKILEDNDTGYVVGDKPTLADAGLLECLLSAEEFIGGDVLQGHDAIQKFLRTMKCLPTIEHYLKKVRQPANSPEYVSNVKTILGRTEPRK